MRHFIILFCIGLLIDTSMVHGQKLPISTDWMLKSSGTFGNEGIKYSFLIACQDTQGTGSGFLISSGFIITNAHVVKGNQPDKVLAISSLGEIIRIKSIIIDPKIDIAILKPEKELEGGLKIKPSSNVLIGDFVYAFGYPLGYKGPSPILTTGYLAGYSAQVDSTRNRISKNLIVNGAFNPGNSGGALISNKTKEVIGIIVSKHAPINQKTIDIINTLSNNNSGLMYSVKDRNGKITEISEAQLIAEVLIYFRSMTQVVIGEAILVDDLIYVLEQNNLKY